MAEMKGLVYPVILIEDGDGYLVSVPDFDIDTQGDSLAEAIYMAKDAIGIMGIQLQDEKKKIPEPFSVRRELEDGEKMALVDIDFTEYRKKHDKRMVKKNCTIPYYLNEAAEKVGVNFSRLLQEALAAKLGI